MVNGIYVDEQVKSYVIKLVFATRNPEPVDPELRQFIRVGGSPRATINLTLAARAAALLDGRTYVTPDDVKRIALDVLRHRILLTYEAEAEEVTTDQIVERVLGKVPVP
jgi:MoxR-like ATPase